MIAVSRWLQVAAHALPAGVDSPLGKRLAGLTFLRLIVLALFLATTELYWARNTPFGGFSSMTGLATAGVAFTLSAIYATLLRHGRRLHVVAHAQLITDQLTWTIIVYLSGGITSGATSLYGLTCLSGAILLDTHGAITAALSGTFCYSTLCAAFTYHLISPPLDQPQAAFVVDSSEMVYPVFSTLMAIATVSVLGAYLAERLRSFGGRLEAATKKAEQAEHLAALGRLAAGLAHEIRNPLGSIRGSIELLRTGGSLADEDSRLCAIVEREVARLNDLVGDMIDLSRPRTPELAESDLAATARAVVELAAGSARGSEVSVRYEGPRSQLARADSDQMRQVLWNLVRNAMQASAAGDEVCVRLEHERNHDAIMEVRDHGPGVAENAREHLFDAFFTTRARGAGIGLAVVKRVIDSHDFSIEVDSSGGKGTTFRVRIPPAHVLILAVHFMVVMGKHAAR